MNVHFGMAAVLACGLYGIEYQLIPPEGSTYMNAPKLANTLEQAVQLLDQKDSIARQVLGDEFVDQYVRSRHHEILEWQKAVTSWERERYLEII